jgi:PhnB protein
MKQINAYLMFDGNCREAMEFYRQCFETELFIMPYSEMPGEIPPEAKTRVAHARISKGPAILMASDTMPGMPGMPFTQGNNFSVSIDCESVEEIDRLFAALGQGGKVTMPLQKTFWAPRFGMLTDRFGIDWMFNYEAPK